MKKVINLVITALALSCASVSAAGNLTEIRTKGEFNEQVLQASRPVFVKFFARWCGSCKHMGPIIDSVAGEYNDAYDFIAIDVDAASSLADEYDVSSLPTMIFFKDGRQVGKITGENNREEVISSMKRYLGLSNRPLE